MYAEHLIPSIHMMRPFIPARDYALSFKFYDTLGFHMHPEGDALASCHLGPYGFLLQHFDVKEFCENYMMHMLVTDLDAWWTHIDSLKLTETFGVRVIPPRQEPWGLRVAYVNDPSDVLWHFAEESEG